MESGKVAVISIAAETVNLGEAEDRVAEAAFTDGRATAGFFFLGAAFTAGRLATDAFFFGAAFVTFLAMASYLLTRNSIPSTDGSDRSRANYVRLTSKV
jgi:hypothetical protein